MSKLRQGINLWYDIRIVFTWITPLTPFSCVYFCMTNPYIFIFATHVIHYFHGLVQDCSNSGALVLDLNKVMLFFIFFIFYYFFYFYPTEYMICVMYATWQK